MTGAARRGGPGRAWVLALLLAGCAGGVHKMVPDAPVRIGRPYSVAGRTYVPVDNTRYDTIGEASWYGSYEQGRPTANGERFDKRRVSAAHPTLPLPSYVEVTRLDTGERMIVRINDRGPFARDRIIDLSREAAQTLGIDRAGHALVRVRRVQPTASQARQLRRGYPVRLAAVTPTASRLGTGPVPQLPQPLPVMPRAPARAFAPTPTYAPSQAYAPPQAYAPAPTPIETPQDMPQGAASDLAPVPRAIPALPPVTSRRHVAPVATMPALRIVVATPDDADAADALATALGGEGAHVEAAGGGYRVVTGPYRDADAQSAALARLRARGYGGAVALDAPIPIPINNPNGPDRP